MTGRLATFGPQQRADLFCHRLEESMISKLLQRFTFIAPVMLIALIGCASTRTHESTGEYVDNSVITLKVKSAIMGDDTLKSSEINVETFKSVVQLSGFVNSQADIKRAVAVAKGVEGVTSVKNDMQLKKGT